MLRTERIRLLLLLLFVSLFSCESYLDQPPKNSVTHLNYWNNENDVEAFVKGMHQSFRSALGDVVVLYRDRGLPFDVLGNTWTRISNNDMSGWGLSHPVFSWWREYDAITLTNQLIENIDRADLSQERKSFYLAQARGLRAYTYFRLIQDFGDVPLCLSSEKVGEKAREPWRNVTNFIHEELNEVSEITPPHSQLKDANGMPIESKQYISCNTAYAINAYVYAWEASWDKSQQLWEKALVCALKVINSQEYSLAANPEAVCEEVLLGNSSEGIFELDYRALSSDDLKSYGAYMAGFCQRYPIQAGTTLKTKRTPRISNDVYFDIFSDDADLRIDAYAWKPRETRLMPSSTTQGAVYIQKWRHSINSTEGIFAGSIEYYEDNEMLIRYADLILLTAEIYYHLGNKEQAVRYLNMIRKRAGASEYSANEGDLKRAIFKERERELFLENKRYYDIIRFGYVRELLRGDFKTLTDDDIENGALFLPVGSDYFNYNTLATQTIYWSQDSRLISN